MDESDEKMPVERISILIVNTAEDGDFSHVSGRRGQIQHLNLSG
jgi:hypothetical protein